ncbi:MAG: hypothetical protein WB762_26445 [Candidatus Sulfotelmatobacter sp.]
MHSRGLADPYSGVGNEWTSAFQTLAKNGTAFILGPTLGGDWAESAFRE